MKHFVNARNRIVAEALDGLLLSAGDGALGRLDLYPDIRVILRTDWDTSRVAVVSGGGAGHEPAHAGFVGRGMLTAAVTGEIFASPSVEAVLAAIRAVTGSGGCLLIVKNYTGDRLNFGLAAERARAEGLDVRMVIVADDVAIPGLKQPRGIAGTIFVHKIAGYLSEQGLGLDAIHEPVAAAAESVVSYGVSLTSCAIPDQPFEERIGVGEAEMGLGIHGEPGAERVPLREVEHIVGDVAARLLQRIDAGRPHALLLNNLGGVSTLEMGVIANAVLSHEGLSTAVELICGPASIMTSLNMCGFSLSLLPLDGMRRQALLAPVEPRAWPGIAGRMPRQLVTVAPDEQPALPPSEHRPSRAVVAAVCERLISLEDELNRLDGKVGDGDTGSTIAAGARAILADIDGLPLADTGALCLAIGRTIGKAMGGSSGVLLSILFTATGEALRAGDVLPSALTAGLGKLKFYGGAKCGDRTMIDALEPALAALAAFGPVEASRAALAGSEGTARMVEARAGRSSYVHAAALEGVPDPGAIAVAEAFAAASAALDGQAGQG
jgi:dihydroxyacetone kinase